MSMFFCVDAGGSTTRAALFDENGRELGRATGGGGALSLGVDVSAHQVLSLWHIVAQSYKLEAHETAFVRAMVGIAGCGLPGRAKALRAALGEFASVEIVPDGLGALIAAQEAGCDMVITVGTGIAGLRADNAGPVHLAGGWGFPAGDRGSGAWLGAQLMGFLFDFVDGFEKDAGIGVAVAKRLLESLGGDPAVLQGWQKAARPSDFAGLVPFIIQGAHLGDTACLRLLDDAAGHVAALAAALGRGGDTENAAPRVALSGGLAETLLPHCREVAPAIEWICPKVDALAGLFAVASGRVEPVLFAPRPGIAEALGVKAN